MFGCSFYKFVSEKLEGHKKVGGKFGGKAGFKWILKLESELYDGFGIESGEEGYDVFTSRPHKCCRSGCKFSVSKQEICK